MIKQSAIIARSDPGVSAKQGAQLDVHCSDPNLLILRCAGGRVTASHNNTGFKSQFSTVLCAAETFTIGVFILRCAVLWLRLSASGSTFSHGPASSARVLDPLRSVSAVPDPPAACVSSDWSPYRGDRGDRCSLLYHYWVLKPPEFQGLESGAAAL